MKSPSDIDIQQTDVLIIGGGLAGCMAAISAARAGAQVLVVEKANTKRSGAAGTGNDHFGIWHPGIHGAAGWSVEDMVEEQTRGGSVDRALAEIVARASFQRVQDLERFGLRFRYSRTYPWNCHVASGEHAAGSEQFRMVPQFSSVPNTLNYDGRDIKRKLTAQMKREGVRILNRVMVTALLTDGDVVVGGAGFHVRTGEFLGFGAKSVVLATGRAIRARLFAEQGGHLFTSMSPPNCTGDGHAIALRAGAEMGIRRPRYRDIGLTGAELKNYPQATALTATTSYPAGRIVNARGDTVAEHMYAPHPPGATAPEQVSANIRDGRWPFYVDLTEGSEEQIRYVEWSMSNEALTWAARRVFEDEGIDLRTHRLEIALKRRGFYGRLTQAAFGVFVDEECRTSLSNLWAAGDMLMQIGGSAVPAVCLGWWAGEMAADRAVGRPDPTLDDRQLRDERGRLLTPLQRTRGATWREVNQTLVAIMEDCVASPGTAMGARPAMRGPHPLRAAADRIAELEALPLRARNPHELMRTHEVIHLLEQGRFLARMWQEPEVDDETCWSVGRVLGERTELAQRPKDRYRAA